MYKLVIAVSLCFGACDTDVKDGFLGDLPDTAGSETVSGDTAAPTDTTALTDTTPDDTAVTTTDSSATETTTTVVDSSGGDTTVDPDATTATDTTTSDTAVTTDVPVATDVVIPPSELEGLGWHAALAPGLVVGAPVVVGEAIAIPVVNGTSVELRAWTHDGDGLFSATVYTGTAPVLGGAVACGDHVYVSGHESDGSKAFIARLAPSGSGLMQVQFYPKVGTTGGSTTVAAPRCGGPGAYAKLEPLGAVTYKANGGGTVQLSVEQTQDRSFLVDLVKAFSEVGTLGTVSADKIRILDTAVAEPLVGELGKEIFYLGEVRVPKQLGATTLQPGDQLVYAHDYTTTTGGTATTVAFYADNDIRGLAVAPDGRFAVHWRAIVPPPATVGEEQRITAFDVDGKQLGTANVSIDAPIARMRWEGDGLVLAGTFTGVPPYPGDNVAAGSWIAVMQVGTSMTVTRSAAFGTDLGPDLGAGTTLVGPLHRVTMSDACEGPAWAVVARASALPGALRVVALGDDGDDCRSASFGLTNALDLDVVPIGTEGDYVVSTDSGARLDLGADVWPAGAPAAYLGLIRARVAYDSAP